MKAFLKSIALLGLFVVSAKAAEITEKTIVYQEGETQLEGYAALPKEAEGKLPVIVVVHQWMGLTDYEKMRCQQLAKLGYLAFAVDIYGQGVRPSSMSEAGAQAGKYKSDRALYRKRLNAGLAEALKQPQADPDKVVAIGYCFGGTGVIELARSGAEIGGVVSFHGGLDSPTPADGAKIKARVLALHGADDPHVKAADLAAFEEEMRKHEVDWELVKYGGAVHAFTQKMAGNDPSKGAAYDARADQRSWQQLMTFLGQVFGQ
ncbi:dienelactone hydrolase family protein [Verrucomicrobiaceae bacterium 5K15]|uniref:Dienelactone hydrolase family protein n=1 Tax=Oceaniferula flava TaxID=2800421 RepID=A0AAE2SDZ2_9BACT|nr:dienelactone hydrolase family protein [Oceaniferula flavus]MBK1855144.1 dienelactone hydrolase family protein [Oceaniferula flavus]MBM1136450.1 dienelactone hydrolase family protein [Oceaniferula flavus]